LWSLKKNSTVETAYALPPNFADSLFKDATEEPQLMGDHSPTNQVASAAAFNKSCNLRKLLKQCRKRILQKKLQKIHATPSLSFSVYSLKAGVEDTTRRPWLEQVISNL
jgi:hypothetical protein